MKYFWTFVWTFLLVQMLYYVAGSMYGTPYDLKLGTLISVAVTAFILLIGTLIPEKPDQKSETSH